MTVSNFIFFGVVTLIALVALLVIGTIVARLYKRATKERSFIRTGFGGEKVFASGGAIIVPILHETLDINMQELPITITRSKQQSLITKDKMRGDISVAFYIRVSPNEEAIKAAAQTLGSMTLNNERLTKAVEGKLEDALRSVAATMDFNEIHLNRPEFVSKVKATVNKDLGINGLDLGVVSLLHFDYTPVQFLDPSNPFDAEGLANLTRITQSKARERNEIEVQTRTEIEQRNLEANEKSLDISRRDEFARLEQVREITNRRVLQESEMAKEAAERRRESELARITAERAIDLANITAIRERDEADITAKQNIEIAKQASNIAINNKSEEESKARASADLARAASIKAAQEVITTEQVSIAEREARVAIIEAEREANVRATQVTIAAKADFDAAEQRAKARTIAAEAEDRENQVRAAGELALAEAANSLSPEQVNLRIRLAAIEVAPALAAELARPMAAIKDARIVSVTGMNGGSFTTNGAGGSAGSSGNVAQDVTSAMLNYRMNLPLAEEIGKIAGINLSGPLNEIGAGLLDDVTNGEYVVPAVGTQEPAKRLSDAELAKQYANN